MKYTYAVIFLFLLATQSAAERVFTDSDLEKYSSPRSSSSSRSDSAPEPKMQGNMKEWCIKHRDAYDRYKAALARFMSAGDTVRGTSSASARVAFDTANSESDAAAITLKRVREDGSSAGLPYEWFKQCK